MIVEIRQANIFDQTQIMYCLWKWLDESPVPYPPINGAFSRWICELLTQGYVLVAEVEGHIVGVVGSQVSYLPWNDEIPIMSVTCLYIDPDQRKHGLANKLVEKIKDFAKQKKILLIISIMSGVKPEEKDRFLQIKGLQYIGGNFCYHEE